MSVNRIPRTVTVTREGLAPKLSGLSTEFLSGAGTFSTIGMSTTGVTILSTTTTLNDTTIKALPTAVSTIISAPGASSLINVLFYRLYGQFTTGYTNINAGAFANFRYSTAELSSGYIGNDTTTTPVLALFSTCFATASNFMITLVPYATTVSPESAGWGIMPNRMFSANVLNKAIEFLINNGGSGNLTGGTTSNTLKISAYYIVDTP